MAFAQTDLDALDAAIARGELEVRVDDKLMRFDTAQGLMERRQFVAAQLAAAQNTPHIPGPRYQLANFCDDGIE